MGVFIYMDIARSVTKKEWQDVYLETLQLVKAFPLAEKREVPVRGIDTMCFVRTGEGEQKWGWNNEYTAVGWAADGDYDSMRTAEEYFLPRDLVKENEYNADAPDAMFCQVPEHLSGYERNDPGFRQVYSLWGGKTQGEPYHMYLLAVACLIESRLGPKAFIYGDITKGQCGKAVRMANEHLERKIDIPDQCDPEKLLKRICALPLKEYEKLHLYSSLYLGKKDSSFGKGIRDHFSQKACEEYWKERFKLYQVNMNGFQDVLDDYLLWGFDLEEMCSFVSFRDKKGREHYEEFVRKIMDAGLHRQDKDCEDILKINPDSEDLYGVSTQFAQLAFIGARNHSIDRYIPLDQIRSALTKAIGRFCPVDDIIDRYLDEEQERDRLRASSGLTEDERKKLAEQDPSYAFHEAMKVKREAAEARWRKYDIPDFELLPEYKNGDSIDPEVEEQAGKYFAFYRSVLGEDRKRDLMDGTPDDRCRWLSETNSGILLRDRDWEKIYEDIHDHRESFDRYYPMVRVKVTSDSVLYLVRAFVVNDDFYRYAFELGKKYGDS